MSTTTPRRSPALETLEFDHLELWVGNAKQAAHYYCTAFGFEPLAYAGPETGLRNRASYAVRQNDLCLVLTSALTPDDPIAEHVRRHGDGVRDVALRTIDAGETYAQVVAGGARGLAAPVESADEHGRVVRGQIGVYGDTVHSLIERGAYRGPWLPGYAAWATGQQPAERVGLLRIDHCVANVGWDEMQPWCDHYARAFGFEQLVSFDDQGHLDRVHRAALQSDAERQRQGQAADQRAGPRAQALADRGVPGVLRRAGRAARRDRHRGHRADRPRAARQRRRAAGRARVVLRTRWASGSARSPRTWRSCAT